MDCEKFEQAMMDELYGELDELTSAAAKRHVAGCSKCAALLDGFRATRRLVALPMVEAPAELEERILTAARDMQKVVPLRRRIANAVSVAGRWAMQPQAAVAVVFFVMLGGSVLLLRPARAPKSAVAVGSPPVTVTEQGAPVPDSPAAVPTTASALAETTPGSSPASDLDGVGKGRGARPGDSHAEVATNATKPAFPSAAPMGEAKSAAGAGLAGGGGQSLSGLTGDGEASGNDLATARSVRDTQGCRAALAAFDRAIQRGRGTPAGWDALLEGALCRRSAGDLPTARIYLQQLLNVDSHKARARQELGLLDMQIAQTQQSNVGPTAGAHAAPRAAMHASEAPAAAAAPAATPAPAAKATAADSF
jgi:hypothetical protein